MSVPSFIEQTFMPFHLVPDMGKKSSGDRVRNKTVQAPDFMVLTMWTAREHVCYRAISGTTLPTSRRRSLFRVLERKSVVSL